jgi:hypothetical protein
MNPGRCCALQVGVNAPGTANKTAFLWVLNSAPKSTGSPRVHFSSFASMTSHKMGFAGITSPLLTLTAVAKERVPVVLVRRTKAVARLIMILATNNIFITVRKTTGDCDDDDMMEPTSKIVCHNRRYSQLTPRRAHLYKAVRARAKNCAGVKMRRSRWDVSNDGNARQSQSRESSLVRVPRLLVCSSVVQAVPQIRKQKE